MSMKFICFTLIVFCSFFTYAQNIPLYVGTFTDADSEGIYFYDFNTKTGEITNKKLAAKTDNPSFITFSSDKKYLYTVHTNGNANLVKSFEVLKDGTLSFINQVDSNGKGPCHVQLNKSNNKLVVSNYSGGTFSIYNINKNGSIQEANQVFDHNIENKIIAFLKTLFLQE